MPNGLGNTVFKTLTSVPILHRFINRLVVSSYADKGPLPGVFTTKWAKKTALWEVLHKKYFALEIPGMTEEDQQDLPDLDAVMALFRRDGPAEESRVTLLLPLFAQHLTDAVFQSDGKYGTDAPHEIILNQIYGNTTADTEALRQHEGGRLRSRTCAGDGGEAEFPDGLLEQTDSGWQVKPCYAGLSHLTKDGKPNAEKIANLLEKYKGREDAVCATRGVLGSFNKHRLVQGMQRAGFAAFDPRYRDQLKTLYKNDPNKVEYAVGILAELPKIGMLKKLGMKDPPILGPTLMNAIAKHAFRHILSNRFMTKEYLNREMLTDFGWRSMKSTSSVADFVRRNMVGEMDQKAADALRITFANQA